MNRLKNPLIAWTGAVLALSFSLSLSSTWASEGHDHGEAPVAASGPALPRFAAVSELFELVGVVNGKQITLYLDRFADGSPVKEARLELELGGIKVPVEAHAEGEFEAILPQALKPGVIAVAATVMVGEESDLLAGELDLHSESTVDEAPRHGWQEILTWVAAGLAGLILLGVIARRRRVSGSNLTGGAA